MTEVREALIAKIKEITNSLRMSDSTTSKKSERAIKIESLLHRSWPNNLSMTELCKALLGEKLDNGNVNWINLPKLVCLVPVRCINGHNYPLNLPIVVTNSTRGTHSGLSSNGHMGNNIDSGKKNTRLATDAEIDTLTDAQITALEKLVIIIR